MDLAEAADHPVGDLNPLAQHKLALARALANAPQVLIVEDAGAHLPPADRPDFFRLPARGEGIVRTGRDRAFLRRERKRLGADRELRMSGGRLCAARRRRRGRMSDPQGAAAITKASKSNLALAFVSLPPEAPAGHYHLLCLLPAGG